jgi:hypothetical protein
VRVLLWHVHAAWATAFVQGTHDYLVPVTPDRGPWGGGRPDTYDWPDEVREVTPEELAEEPVDVVVLQRVDELDLVTRWTRRRPGVDLPAVFVEHNTPRDIVGSRHPLAVQTAIPIVHVTHFNALMWDNGCAPVVVVEHGVPDPGPLWTGEVPHGAVVVNEPVRRGRVTGTDLLPLLATAAPLDLYGIGTETIRLDSRSEVVGHGDLPHGQLLAEVARRRVYVHTTRWTSLGLALVEAMHLGMPVAALGTTEVAEALQGTAAVVSTDVHRLVAALRLLVHDLEAAQEIGRSVREAALTRYSLDRFLTDWDRLLEDVSR